MTLRWHDTVLVNWYQISAKAVRNALKAEVKASAGKALAKYLPGKHQI
uniref:Uncharacterized protein n=1 Tax=Equus asinus TaxID=9793 RepID=A0A9L0JXB5_EQUAS